MKKLLGLFVFILLFNLTGTAQKKYAKRLEGQWNISSYEEIRDGKSAMSMANVGTMIFKKDFTGLREMSFSIMNKDQSVSEEFTWTATEESISINSKDEEFPKTWILKSNKKTVQEWISTDSKGRVLKMKLEKKK
jgi:hypothetical protein